MATQTKLVTYDDYRKLPNDGKRYEIIEGELFMTPAPSTRHQRILGKLYKLISNYVEEKDLGEVLMAPVDVVLSMMDVVQPDLIYVSKDRENITTKKNIVAAPDLVIEILSENTAPIDQNRKKTLYEKYGVKEYWIVDPDENYITQYSLQEDAFALHAELDESEKLTSKVIEGYVLPLADVFAD